MTPFSFIDGFPISRGCKMKEKISVKTRDCEHKIVGGFFERRCFCRRMLCNLGYDDRYKLFNRYVHPCGLLYANISTHDNILQAGYNERGNKRKGASIQKSWQQSGLLFLQVPDFCVFHTDTMNG